MKRILIISLLFFHWLTCAYAGGDVTPMLSICRNIELGLHSEFLKSGGELPKSLNEIAMLNEYVGRDPMAGKLLNEMVAVPGAPVIKRGSDIQSKHFDWRIFAIGRTTNSDYALAPKSEGKDSAVGRYSVWISPDGTYCSPGWTPESEVQAVFKQIGGFDPAAQPLAFPDAESRVRDKELRKAKIRKEVESAYRKHVARKLKDRFLPKKNNGEELPHRISRLVFIIMGLVLLVGIAFIVGKKKRG